MNTQPPGFSVLSTPVALCDRRALSEAWYSALHIQKEPGRGAGPRQASVITRAAGMTESLPGTVARAARPPTLNRAVRIGAALALPGAPVNDRRISPSKLAQKIERVFLKPEQPPRHASFALEGSRGRVQILLQQSGGQTQIIALCPPAAREAVAHALAQVRYALSLRGLHLQTDVRGFAR